MKNIVDIIYKESLKAYKKDEIPVGAAIVYNNKIISKAHNNRQTSKMITGHAEINCIVKAAKKLRDWRLSDCDLYVTLKPCKMCEEVIKQSRINKVYYLCESKYNNEKRKTINYQKLNNEINKEYKEKLSKFFSNKR